ncbi:MAG: hypothetical protein QME51_00345 [Planctomycetota bacterium]|nr:hypothetical protein [Planctomycetota bacterium]MDI6786809.1 hypothetical protein [Planctomycetota bacterium]
MIRIDLLPEERRHKERTPLPRFLAMNAAIIVCLLLIIWNVYIIADINRLEEREKADSTTLQRLQKETQGYDNMLKKERELSEWNKAMSQIMDTRAFFWWEKIDELWDVINNAGDIWIASLQALDSAPGGYRGGGKAESAISMNCFTAGISSERMTGFRIKLKNHEGLRKTFNLGLNEPPQFQVVAQPEYQEEFAVSFNIDLVGGKK